MSMTRILSSLISSILLMWTPASSAEVARIHVKVFELAHSKATVGELSDVNEIVAPEPDFSTLIDPPMDNGMEWSRGDVLGRGSFATVSLAFVHEPCQWQLPSVVAVKSAPLSLSGSLRHEYSVLGELQGCRQIVRCFGDEVVVDEATGVQSYNLLLEFADGGSLQDAVRRSGRGLGEPTIRRHIKLQNIHNGRRFPRSCQRKGRISCGGALSRTRHGGGEDKRRRLQNATAADEDTEYELVQHFSFLCHLSIYRVQKE